MQWLTKVFLLVLLVSPLTSEAAIPLVYTNDNYWTSEHDTPVSFQQDSLGNFSGYTTTGKYFTQTSIINNYQVKLQKFTIDEAYFYVSDIGAIRAKTDLTALSIYLAEPLV